MIRKSFLLVAMTFALGSVAVADDSLCTLDVASKLQDNCCSASSSWNKQKNCYAKYNTKFKGIKSYVGANIVKSMNSEVVRLRADQGPRCEAEISDDAEAISLNACVDLSSISNTINKRCCKKEYKGDRSDCLKQAIQKFKNIRKNIDSDVYQAILKDLKTKQKAKSCGAGGKEYTAGCQVMEGYDGAGGFLHKYPSDHGDIALLLPSKYSASACGYVTLKGKQLFGLRYDRRTNGNRQTFRGGSCAAFGGNKPVYARCNIGGVKHCWLINNPCTRQE